MTVSNKSSVVINACIGAWDSNQSVDWYTLPPGGSESWDRPSDSRGYILVMSLAGDADYTYTYWMTGGIDVNLYMTVSDETYGKVDSVGASYMDGRSLKELPYFVRAA